MVEEEKRDLLQGEGCIHPLGGLNLTGSWREGVLFYCREIRTVGNEKVFNGGSRPSGGSARRKVVARIMKDNFSSRGRKAYDQGTLKDSAPG